jgi:hypothetical protein
VATELASAVRTTTALFEPAATPVVLRHADRRDPRDAAAVRAIFRATLVIGRPTPLGLHPRILAAYERLCLDWYLRHGTVVLAERDGIAIGYLLACLDEAAHGRWLRRAALRWLGVSAVSGLVGRLRGDTGRFVRTRLQDGWRSWRHAPAPVVPAHAHLNLLPGARAARHGRDLARVMDDLVAAAGLPGWYGEMNVPPGRSLAAVERAGSAVVHRQPSATFTDLLGVPVERITLARIVACPDPTDRDPRRPDPRPARR